MELFDCFIDGVQEKVVFCFIIWAVQSDNKSVTFAFCMYFEYNRFVVLIQN